MVAAELYFWDREYCLQINMLLFKVDPTALPINNMDHAI